MAELPSVQDMWEKARKRYETDAPFHALAYTTAELLRMPVEHVLIVVHAVKLAESLLSLSADMQAGLTERQTELRKLGETMGYVDAQGRMTQKLIDDLGIAATVSEDGNDLIPRPDAV